MWQLLLMNIKSPSTTALLKLATPLQILPEGVVLTFKNEKLVTQLSDSNKKQLIIDAANTIFNQETTHVTVRLAQSGDKPVQSAPKTIEKPSEEGQSNVQENVLEIVAEKTDDNIDDTKINRVESDQEKMILDLFDGKYIE